MKSVIELNSKIKTKWIIFDIWFNRSYEETDMGYNELKLNMLSLSLNLSFLLWFTNINNEQLSYVSSASMYGSYK